MKNKTDHNIALHKAYAMKKNEYYHFHNLFSVSYWLVQRLKLLGVEKERDLSSLVTEAIEDLIKKYE